MKKRPGSKSESIGGEREEGRKSSLDNAKAGQVVSPAELWLQRLPLKGDHRANGWFVVCATPGRRAGGAYYPWVGLDSKVPRAS